jgi:hypothetical protein
MVGKLLWRDTDSTKLLWSSICEFPSLNEPMPKWYIRKTALRDRLSDINLTRCNLALINTESSVNLCDYPLQCNHYFNSYVENLCTGTKIILLTS